MKNSRSQHLSRALDGVAIIASILLLISLSLDIVTRRSYILSPGVEELQLVVCMVFVMDFVVQTMTASKPKRFFARNIVLLVVSIPYLNMLHWGGVELPKVAPLAAVEVVNPKMPVTVEAAELTRLCEAGEIKDCIVDGPLSLDLAIDPEAALHKGATDRKIQGDADVLLFPDIHAGNQVYKVLVHTVPGIKNGCILAGTKVPVILTSRSDTFETKVNSIALAAVVAAELNK
jgi:hypothetical protein